MQYAYLMYCGKSNATTILFWGKCNWVELGGSISNLVTSETGAKNDFKGSSCLLTSSLTMALQKVAYTLLPECGPL